jgi:hypothetical protein
MTCNYTSPSGFIITASSHTSSGGGSSLYYNTSTWIQTTSRMDDLIEPSLVKFAMARLAPPYSYEEPDVTECSMRWCARIIQNTTAVNGTFNLGNSEDINLIGIKPDEDLFWNRFEIDQNNTSFPGNRTFRISPTDNQDIKEFLQKVFSSKIDDPFGLALLNSSNLTETLSSISTSMTYALGQSPSGVNVEGQTISTEQYILVAWPWIILPLAEVVMAVALLLCTLIHTWRSGVTSWKSSGIIPMLTVMDGWDSTDIKATSWRETEKRSKLMRGVLVTNAEGMLHFNRRDT